MTHNIVIASQIGVLNISPSEVKWRCGVSNYTDTCSITIPNDLYTEIQYAQTVMPQRHKVQFTEGMPITVSVGYDDNNTERFKGFISRINAGTPLTLECEGFSYQLKNKYFSKSYGNTTLKAILTDLTVGTDIKLSPYIPHLPLQNVWFKNCPGLKVLDWFAHECLCVVYFDGDMLFVGASKFTVPRQTVKLSVGYNTVTDKDLKKADAAADVRINIVCKDSGGKTQKTKSGQKKYTSTKEVKVRAGLPQSFLSAVAKELQQIENYKGYEGSITCFLHPVAEKGAIIEVTDNRHTDRSGRYFVDTVEGSYNSSGGRQKLTLRRYGNN